MIRLRTNDDLLGEFVDGNEVTGALRIPLLTLHSTGDGQVPIEQARILRRRVDAAGAGDLLVQRVIRDAGHCGFTTTEWLASFEALVAWVEEGIEPAGNDLLDGDLEAPRPSFELRPRPGLPDADAVPGAGDRMRRPWSRHDRWCAVQRPVPRRSCAPRRADVGVPAHADGGDRWSVRADGDRRGRVGRVRRTRSPRRAVDVCRRRPAVRHQRTHMARERSRRDVRRRLLDGDAARTRPGRVVVRRRDPRDRRPVRPAGHPSRGLRRQHARCAITSTRHTGSFSGYVLFVVGPDAVPGCAPGATFTFRVDGQPAAQTALHEPGQNTSLDLTMP